MEENKQINSEKQEQDKKKKRKLLMCILIPVGALALTAAIVAPVVSCNYDKKVKLIEGSDSEVSIKESDIQTNKESTIILTIPEGKEIDETSLEVTVGGTKLNPDQYEIKDGNKIVIHSDVMKSKDVSIKVVTKPKKDILEIKIKDQAKKTKFYVGDKFTSEGLTLEVAYNDQTTEIIEKGFDTDPKQDYVFNDSDVAKEKQVKVTYKAKEATYPIEIIKPTLEKIEIQTDPTKKTFKVGETFESTGLTLKATYDNKTTKVIDTGFTTNFDNKKFDSSDKGNDKEVTVSYIEGSITKSLTYKINVIDATFDKLTIKTQPTQKIFFVGEKFNCNGLKLEAVYTDRIEEITTGFSTDWDNKSFTTADISTKKTVTVTYNTKTVTYDIEVKADTLDKIEVKTGTPNKTSFKVGEKFSSEGLILNTYYTHSPETAVEVSSGYVIKTYQPDYEFKTEDIKENIEITVGYTVDGIEKTTTYKINVVAATEDFVKCGWDSITTWCTKLENGEITEEEFMAHFGKPSEKLESLVGSEGRKLNITCCGKTQEYTAVIIGVKHDLLVNQPQGKSGVKATLTFGVQEALSDSDGNYIKCYWDFSAKQASSNKNYDYTNSWLRKNLNGADGYTPKWYKSQGETEISTEQNSVFSMLSNEVQSAIKPVVKQVAKSSDNGTTYTLTPYNDKIFPLTYTEMGYTDYVDQGYAKKEGEVYKYWTDYTESAYRVLYDFNWSACPYALSTPLKVNQNNLICGVSTEGVSNSPAVFNKLAPFFAFCI